MSSQVLKQVSCTGFAEATGLMLIYTLKASVPQLLKPALLLLRLQLLLPPHRWCEECAQASDSFALGEV